MSVDEPNPSLPPDVIDAFASSVVTALRELAQIEVVDEPRPTKVEWPKNSILAVVRLMRQVPGTMSLVLPVEAAERLAACYLPEGTTLADDIVDDMAGEFVNVIAGQAKTILKGTPYHYTQSLPEVSRESTLLESAAKLATLVASFESFQILLLVDLKPCDGA